MNIKTKQLSPLNQVAALHDEGESMYLDNGGCLTAEERDHLFVKAMALATKFAKELEAREVVWPFGET